MKRLCTTIIASLVFASISAAQPLPAAKIKEMMDKNLELEKDGKYREALAGWRQFLQLPQFRGANLVKPPVQEIFYPAYFYHVRSLYKVGAFDPEIKDRQKFIDMSAKMIIKIEFSKNPDGWKLVEPMVQKLFEEKDSEQLKKAYDYQKSQRLKEVEKQKSERQ